MTRLERNIQKEQLRRRNRVGERQTRDAPNLRTGEEEVLPERTVRVGQDVVVDGRHKPTTGAMTDLKTGKQIRGPNI